MFWRCIDPKEIIPKEKRLKTKIIATIGSLKNKRYDLGLKVHEKPTYNEFFNWFIQKGHLNCLMIDVIRLNMSFYADDGNTEVYDGAFQWMENNKRLSKNIAILCDLSGPKTRIGELKEMKIDLKPDQPCKLFLDKALEGDSNQISVLSRNKPLLKAVSSPQDILDNLQSAISLAGPEGIEISIGDGEVILRANDKSLDYDNGTLNCRVSIGGEIEKSKGVTFEKVNLQLPAFDEYDQKSLRYILDKDNGRGFVALVGVSFARNACDILSVKKFINEYYADRNKKCDLGSIERTCPDIIAKIET